MGSIKRKADGEAADNKLFAALLVGIALPAAAFDFEDKERSKN